MKRWVVAGVGALVIAGAVAGSAIAFAGNDAEGGVTGRQADLAAAAALAATKGGTANAVERDGEDGGVWEVEVATRDGAVVDVRLDEHYAVIAVEWDHENADTGDSGS